MATPRPWATAAQAPGPYLCSMASEYASLTRWYGVEHPSLPDYIDLASGADQGCAADTCAGLYPATDLGGQLHGGGDPLGRLHGVDAVPVFHRRVQR